MLEFRIDDVLAGKSAGDWADAYRTADPFPHVVIDDFFPADSLRPIAAEVRGMSIESEAEVYSSSHKRRQSDIAKLGPLTRRFIEELHTPRFLIFLQDVTGVPALVPDPYLKGGGVHQIGRGGFLKVHSDFNWHKRLRLHRRLNLLLYLNEGWREEWGGALELWDRGMQSRRRSLAPIFNRMVVFSTTDDSYHGHPDPLECPPDVLRNSIALYYYTSEQPKSEIRFGKSMMTNYQARDGDAFKHDPKYVRHQATIRLPFLQRLLSLRHRKP